MKSYYRHYIFCALQFIASTTGSISLCMSSYGLATNIHEPWAWQHYTVSGCILISIIVNALKDSFISNPKIFEDQEEKNNFIENMPTV